MSCFSGLICYEDGLIAIPAEAPWGRQAGDDVKGGAIPGHLGTTASLPPVHFY